MKVLHVLNNKVSTFQLVILVIWITFTLFAFGYFIQNKLVNFDSRNKLKDLEYKELSVYFSPYTNQGENKGKQTILHFSTPNCDCQRYSDKHIQEINVLADKYNFAIRNIEINEHEVIPSTPSVALLDKSGEVVYFGPYGQGLACSETSGYAQTILNNYLKGYSANIVIKEAKGCYCTI